ncbi:unnamed protein product [Prorocentrum cordatum]|nr:unnamed protein product [Polarella glacialis]
MMRKLIDDQSHGGGGPADRKPRGAARRRGPPTTWDSVVGIDGARLELMEVIDFMRNPGRYRKMGAQCPRGILLSGPPGCGKTLLARAAAHEARMSFLQCSASDFVEVFVGRGAARVRELFRSAHARAPCILFFDELDALAKARSGGPHGNDEREQTLNQLLTEMDGFDSCQGERSVLVIAATNRPDVLDAALLRPGRFDRHVRVPPLDQRGRRAVLEVHARARGVPLERHEDLEGIARASAGFSGAELANVINEAALLAARGGGEVQAVRATHLEEALDKVRDAQAGPYQDAQSEDNPMSSVAQVVQMMAAAAAAEARHRQA